MAKKKKKAKKKPLVKTTKKQAANKGHFKKGNKPKGGFKKGQSGNPKGRPKGTKERDLMLAARTEAEKAAGITLYRKAFDMALTGDKYLIRELLKKLVPDLKYIESDAAQSLTDIYALMVGKN